MNWIPTEMPHGLRVASEQCIIKVVGEVVDDWLNININCEIQGLIVEVCDLLAHIFRKYFCAIWMLLHIVLS